MHLHLKRFRFLSVGIIVTIVIAGLLASFKPIYTIGWLIRAEECGFCECCEEEKCGGDCFYAGQVDTERECRSLCSPYSRKACWYTAPCGTPTPTPTDGGGGGGGGGNRECWGDCRGFIKHKACNLRLDSVGDTTASFSWQPADPLTTKVVISVCRWWNVRYADPSQCEVYKQDVTGLSSFTATNLWPDTDYWAQIATVGGADICQDVYYWDGKVAFHTLSNQPPSCDLSALPSSLTYDGRAFYDRNRNGARIQQDPTTHDYAIATSDPDGDTVTIASVTVSQPACLQATHDGSTLHITPQGALTGHPNPPLSGANTCSTQVTVEVDDGNGGTGTCSKDLTIVYPRPRVYLLRLRDLNPVALPGEDATPRNLLSDAQFATVCSKRLEVGGWKLARPDDYRLPTVPPATGYSQAMV